MFPHTTQLPPQYYPVRLGAFARNPATAPGSFAGVPFAVYTSPTGYQSAAVYGWLGPQPVAVRVAYGR